MLVLSLGYAHNYLWSFCNFQKRTGEIGSLEQEYSFQRGQLLRLVKVVRVLSSSFHSLFFQKLKVQVATTFLIWGPIVEVVLITPFGDMKLSFAVPVKVLLVRILPFAVSAFSVHFNGVPSAIPFREMKPPQNQP